MLLHCFFEGDDELYYGVRIDSVRRERYRAYSCAGKAQVLLVRKLIRENETFSTARVFFFVDRDYDELNIDDECVYCLPCHSIENLYADYFSVEKILLRDFNLKIKSSSFFSCSSLFIELFEEFVVAMVEFTCWLSIHSKKEKLAGVRALNLNNYGAHRFVDISLDGVKKKYNVEIIKELFSNAHEISPDEINAEKATNKRNPSCFVRGKFVAEFLMKFFNLLIEESSSDRYKIFTDGKVRKRPLVQNVISEFSQYAKTPPCLVKFLTQHI